MARITLRATFFYNNCNVFFLFEKNCVLLQSKQVYFFCDMNTAENIAYNTLQAGIGTAYIAPKQTKNAKRSKRRMSVDEYFGKVLKKLDEHYADIQESRD